MAFRVVIYPKNVLRKLESIDKSQAGVSNAVHNAGFKLEKEIKESIAGRKGEPRSVDTGRFMNSISTDNSAVDVSVVSSNVPYAEYLEFGTSRIPQRQHFRNSLIRKRREIASDIFKEIKL